MTMTAEDARARTSTVKVTRPAEGGPGVAQQARRAREASSNANMRGAPPEGRSSLSMNGLAGTVPPAPTLGKDE